MPVARKAAPGSIGGRVRALREERGLTRDQLAKAAGVPYGTIMVVEQQRNATVRSNIVVALADALGVSTDALLRGW